MGVGIGVVYCRRIDHLTKWWLPGCELIRAISRVVPELSAVYVGLSCRVARTRGFEVVGGTGGGYTGS